MNSTQKQIWIEALRSGKYVQARGAFTYTPLEDDGSKGASEHCCLAVLSHEAANAGCPGMQWATEDGEEKPKVLFVFYHDDDDGFREVKTVDEAKHVLATYEPYSRPQNGDDYSYPANGAYEWRNWEEEGDGALPKVVEDWAGLDGTNPMLGDRRAIVWNDTDQADFGNQADFGKIADLIEENL